MSACSDIALQDPVSFALDGKTVEGHVARKTVRKCTVVATNGKTYEVPWVLVSRRDGAERRRVNAPSDAMKSKFRPGDQVEFEYWSTKLRGKILRMNPKRARVVCADASEYNVPYGALVSLHCDAVRDDAHRLQSVTLVAERLMTLHRLAGWSFQFDDSTRSAGSCNYQTRVIGMSRHYALHATDAERKDTILHEIAHALVGPKHHHDSVWKAAARAIGCAGERCHQVDFAPPRYIATCPRCSWSEGRNLRLRRAVCKACGTPVRYLTFAEADWRSANTRRH